MNSEYAASTSAGLIAFLANTAGSATAPVDGWFPVILQSGALGVLAFVLWHIFAKLIPRILDSMEKSQERFFQEQKNSQERFIQEAAKMREDFRQTIKDLADNLKK